MHTARVITGTIVLAFLAWVNIALAGTTLTLPKIGPAPAFSLTNQDNKLFRSEDQRGKVSVVTFIFTRCADTCPLLTAKLVSVQRKLAAQAKQVSFAAITVDPEYDTAVMLKQYAQSHAVNPENFVFLTGTEKEIAEVARRFAVYRKAQPGGSMDHAFLTSIIDQHGMLRVQYLGTRFDPKEFEADIRSLLTEPGR